MVSLALRRCSQKPSKIFLRRLPQIEYFLKNYDKKFKITVRELDLTLNHNYRPQLMRAKYESKRILLSCSIEQLPVILTQAQQMGLFNGNHSFIVTSLDMHTIDLQRFQYSRTNITSVRIISPENPLVDEVTRFFADSFVEKNQNRNNRESYEDESGLEEFSAEKMKLKHALIFDSGEFCSSFFFKLFIIICSKF